MPVSQRLPELSLPVRDVRAACRAGLAIEARGAIDRPVVLVSEASEFVDTARTHGAVPLLIAHADGIGLPANVIELLVSAQHDVVEKSLRVAIESAAAYRVVTESGIPALVIKGVPLSILTTGSPAGRDTQDVDLLVPPSRVPEASHALASAGWEPRDGRHPQDGSAWRHLRWSLRERPYWNGLTYVDLHWKICYESGLFPLVETLLDRCVPVSFGNASLRTLEPSDALAVACLTAYSDRMARLKNLIDVARLADDPRTSIPIDATPRLRRLVAEVVTFTAALLGSPSPERAAALGGGDHAQAPFLARLWLESASRPLWHHEVVTLREYPLYFRHQTRYGNRLESAARFALSRVIDDAQLDPAGGVRDIAGAASAKVRGATSNRLHGRHSTPT